MKKLSKILNESAWGDMRRRSTGEMIRREDELNSKSPEEFVDYLKDHYVINDYRVSDIKYIPNRFINIPVALVGGREYIHTWYLTFDPDNGELTISSDLKQNAKKLWPKLIKKFKLHNNGSCAFVKDKSINNTYALEFIDFIIDNIDDNVTCCISRKTNESAWGDMRKRSIGEIIRKEDDINNYDGLQMADYINDHYTTIRKGFEASYSKVTDTLSVSVIEWKINEKHYHMDTVFYEYDTNTIYIAKGFYEDTFKRLMFRSPFSLSIYDDDYYSIIPKKGDVNNRFFIEVIDFIIDNTTGKQCTVIAKKTNESAWGDMRKRSIGEIIRKEDDINNYSGEDMVEYIRKHYIIMREQDPQYSGIFDALDFLCAEWPWPEDAERTHRCYLCYEYKSNTISINKRILDVVKFNDEFNISTYKESLISIKPKKGKVDNKFFIKVIDYIIDNINGIATLGLRKKKVNESVWGDMRKRSTGEITRKEDTLNIKDMKPIDLGSDFPVYWADIDLEANGEDRFDWEDVQKMIPRIEKTGWRLPKGPMEIRNMFGKDIKKRNEYLHRIWDDKGPVCKGILSSDETGETLEFIADKPGFYVSISYWCESDYEPANGNRQQDTERSFDVNEYCSYEGNFSLIAGNNEVKTKRIKIRLVKDK